MFSVVAAIDFRRFILKLSVVDGESIVKRKTLAVQLKNARLKAGLSQREAADTAGITPDHLCELEKDRSVPSVVLLRRLREIYGVREFTVE